MLNINEFMSRIQTKVESLRKELRRTAPKSLQTLPDANSKFSGYAYVESVGTTLRFKNGFAEFFYEPRAAEMRDVAIAEYKERTRIFEGIARQIPAPSRVLNVGAGGDVAMVASFINQGHELISTDLSKATVQALTRKISHPAFACDLTYLDRVVPAPVDFFIGNSVLAYLDPSKTDRVVSNVHSLMEKGGAFTFDLTPHPSYFDLIEEGSRQETCANPSGADPTKLLHYMQKYGVKDGMGAMAYHAYYRALSTNVATISILRSKFERLGAKCATGLVEITAEGGATAPCLILRVARSFEDILQPLPGETAYDDLGDFWDSYTHRGKSPWFLLQFIDRSNGEAIARLCGIHRDRRSDPWLVAEYVAEQQDAASLPANIRQEVLADISPSSYALKIAPYLSGKPVPSRRPLPRHIAADQVYHSQVITGTASFDQDGADRLIDEQYANADDSGQKSRQQRREEERRAARGQHKGGPRGS